jgi:hypothetical protein
MTFKLCLFRNFNINYINNSNAGDMTPTQASWSFIPLFRWLPDDALGAGARSGFILTVTVFYERHKLVNILIKGRKYTSNPLKTKHICFI